MISEESEFDHLHLACGITTPAGWLNVDGSWQVVLARHPTLKYLLVWCRLLSRTQAEIPWNPGVLRLNLIRPLPFSADTFQVIYCSHLLEHLYHSDALTLLMECHRILKRGGICRFVVPDLESLVQRYLQTKQRSELGAGTRLMEAMLMHDKEPRSGLLGWYYRLTAFHQHKWMYDAESLTALFSAAGFSDAKPVGYLKSRILRIAEVENPGRILEGEGIVVEASKE